jgi:hypothetical protein
MPPVNINMEAHTTKEQSKCITACSESFKTS